MNVRPNSDSPQTKLARSVRAAVAGAMAAGLLLLAACSPGGSGVVTEAVAAQQSGDADPYVHFPSHFPAPEGTPEPHIEAI